MNASRPRNIPNPTSDLINGQPPLTPQTARRNVGSRQETTGRSPRRPGRPRGPERVALSVRVLPETDAKLTRAVEITGNNPQSIVEEALTLYFAKHKIRLDPPEQG
ncbi:hypothetical protein [Streptomyces sp. NPDC053720]|uniref:hypothetical protein n=1 Tax=Streptomyces sp. NPDC053720 TaxID=3154855 RepID=UPI0034392314